jgi:hypothetical protein
MAQAWHGPILTESPVGKSDRCGQARSGPQPEQFYVMFSRRVPHRVTCQPPWRERLGAEQPGSRWLRAVGSVRSRS